VTAALSLRCFARDLADANSSSPQIQTDSLPPKASVIPSARGLRISLSFLVQPFVVADVFIAATETTWFRLGSQSCVDDAHLCADLRILIYLPGKRCQLNRSRSAATTRTEWSHGPFRRRAQSHATTLPPSNGATYRFSAPQKA
jgi:hypothetical protein